MAVKIIGKNIISIMDKTARLTRTMETQLHDKEEVFRVVNFMCLNRGYFHIGLELVQADKSKLDIYKIPPVCTDGYYFYNDVFKLNFKSVRFHSLCTFVGILLPIVKVQLDVAVGILRHQGKPLAQQVFSVKLTTSITPKNMRLQLLVTIILDCIVEELIGNTKNIGS